MSAKYSIVELDMGSLKLDIDLFKDLSLAEPFQCNYRNKIVILPKALSVTETFLCQKCIAPYLSHKNLSDETIDLKELGKIANNTLNNLILKCPNLFCKQEVKYQILFEHVNTCVHTMRTSYCGYCEKRIFSSTLKTCIDKHMNECSLYPLTCKYCRAGYVRHDIKAHEDSCELREHNCIYCGKVYTLPGLDKHRANECIQSVYTKCQSETSTTRGNNTLIIRYA
jgi:hypothetical protein